jgi:hypothetical protein
VRITAMIYGAPFKLWVKFIAGVRS